MHLCLAQASTTSTKRKYDPYSSQRGLAPLAPGGALIFLFASENNNKTLQTRRKYEKTNLKTAGRSGGTLRHTMVSILIKINFT